MFCANSPSLSQKSAGEISEGALETGGTAHLQSMSKIEPQTVRRRKSDSGCHGMPWDAVSRDTFGDFMISMDLSHLSLDWCADVRSKFPRSNSSTLSVWHILVAKYGYCSGAQLNLHDVTAKWTPQNAAELVYSQNKLWLQTTFQSMFSRDHQVLVLIDGLWRLSDTTTTRIDHTIMVQAKSRGPVEN